MPTIDMIKTGENIKTMRKRNHMTVDELAKACGISHTAVCKWQSGASVPSIDNFIILSFVWQIPIDEIIVRT